MGTIAATDGWFFKCENTQADKQLLGNNKKALAGLVFRNRLHRAWNSYSKPFRTMEGTY